MSDLEPMWRFIHHHMHAAVGSGLDREQLYRSAFQAACACERLGGKPLGWAEGDGVLLDFNPGPSGLVYGLYYRNGEFSVHS